MDNDELRAAFEALRTKYGKFQKQMELLLNQNEILRSHIVNEGQNVGDILRSGVDVADASLHAKFSEDQLDGIFKAVDEDMSGEIDPDEFERALDLLGEKLEPEEITDLFKEIDEDKSGTIDTSSSKKRSGTRCSKCSWSVGTISWPRLGRGQKICLSKA